MHMNLYESNIFTFGKCFAKRNIVCFQSRYTSIFKICRLPLSVFFKQCTSAVYQIISIKFSKLRFIQSQNCLIYYEFSKQQYLATLSTLQSCMFIISQPVTSFSSSSWKLEGVDDDHSAFADTCMERKIGYLPLCRITFFAFRINIC